LRVRFFIFFFCFVVTCLEADSFFCYTAWAFANIPMSILSKIFGDSNSRYVKSLAPTIAQIDRLEAEITALSDTDFPLRTKALQEKVATGATLDSILPEAFALVREASRRTLGLRHYEVQLVGGIALHQGRIAEMRTGEGKTLVATLPVYLNALTGKGVHVVTVNDYLARRDAVWMGVVYSFLGLSIGVINSQNTSYVYDPSHTRKEGENEEAAFKVQYEFLRPSNRKDSYAADITYGTNNEFGFDYLRDNLVQSKEQLSQRGHTFAVVDEIDSILIDEARTPLIISQPQEESGELYAKFAGISRQLIKDQDYTVDEKMRAIQLTDMGITKAEDLLGISNIYTEKGIKYVHHLETAVKAQALYERDKDYVNQNGEIVIVDAFTGRLMPGRRWNEGLHQAVEAKEGVKVQAETRAVASITFQNYFRFYDKLGGMTGTASTSREEFFKVYGLEVITIPTNKEIRRVDHNDFIFQTEKGKFRAIATTVKELQAKGQPVLIGTVSIEKNEILSAYLGAEGVKHTILNAKNHEREGEIIAEAGKRGSVVLATNMAGRGVDIKLGGPMATSEEAEEIRTLGGLFVLGTERHEARRIDNQLRGRAGRQGDPGATQFFVSLEDDLMRIFGSDNIKNMMGKFGIPEDQPIENSLINRAIETAQTRIEGFNFDARKYTLEYDDVLNHQRKSVYDRRKAMLFSDRVKINEYLTELTNAIPDLASVIADRKSRLGEDAFYEAVRRIVLYVTDILWVEHLETMEYLRSSVNLRAYGQREPLVEYRKEGLRLFREMEEAHRAQVTGLIETLSQEAVAAPAEKTNEPQHLVASHEEMGQFTPAKSDEEKKAPAVEKVTTERVGRNDLCPCGSGKKFKKCHGA
jgi:preprotein translocase subunit SecA